ncbi:MAG TPA: YwaF family protein [Anaerolineae bacterium]|nr:YwaF family protein [Anaerolineae bacterium]
MYTLQQSILLSHDAASELINSFLIIILTIAGIFTILTNRNCITKKTRDRALFTLWIVILLNINIGYISAIITLDYGIIPVSLIEPLQSWIPTFSLLWLTWLWAFPSVKDASPALKYIFLLASIFLLGAQIAAMFFPIFQASFLISYQHLLWLILQIATIIICFIALLIEQEKGWIYGLLFLTFHLIGLLPFASFFNWHLDTAGIMGISRTIAYALVPTVTYGMVYKQEDDKKNKDITQPTIASENIYTFPRRSAFQSWLELAIQNQEPLVKFALCKALAKTCLAEYCFLISANKKTNSIDIIAGYNNRRSQLIPESTHPVENDEFLTTIIQTKKYVSRMAKDIPNHLKDLQKNLGIKKNSNLLFLPLKPRGKEKSSFAFLLTSRITSWNKDHLLFLTKVTDELVRILQKNKEELHKRSENEMSIKEKEGLGNIENSIETPKQTIKRLKTELHLALDEYSRIRKLLEEKNFRTQNDFMDKYSNHG